MLCALIEGSSAVVVFTNFVSTGSAVARVYTAHCRNGIDVLNSSKGGARSARKVALTIMMYNSFCPRFCE